jgi:ribosomal-protein-alanine N-acetyltransferase
VIRTHAVEPRVNSASTVLPTRAVVPDWRGQLPVLGAHGITLRELRSSDAASLHQLLTTADVGRFISPPPATAAGFERFIEWTHRERQAGTHVCFAVVPEGMDCAVGIFQVRRLGSTFDTAEWGFALGKPFWGTGMFAACAHAVVDFAIDTLHVRRLEARSAVGNGRGNGALKKLGACPEAVLRKSFIKDGQHHDQVLWAIDAVDWRFFHGARPPRVH